MKEKSKDTKMPIDWYIKWGASIMLLIATAIRSTGQFPQLDVIVSWFGIAGWLYVSLIWKDRALIVVNGAAIVMLTGGVINIISKFVS